MHRRQGITLIELMVTVAVIAIVLLLATPSFIEFLARRRLEGASTELSTDLQYARSLAVNHNTNVTLTTLNDGLGYDISGSLIENGTQTLNNFKAARLLGGAHVSSNVVVSFEPHRGMRATTGNDPAITVTSDETAASLRISVNQMGSVQVCSPLGTFGAYPICADSP